MDFFFIATTTGVSAIIGLSWAILESIRRRNIQGSFQVFLCSFIGGEIGGIAGYIVGYLVGENAARKTNGLFVSSPIIVFMLWLSFFWILGIIIGAVVGGFRGMNRIE